MARNKQERLRAKQETNLELARAREETRSAGPAGHFLGQEIEAARLEIDRLQALAGKMKFEASQVRGEDEEAKAKRQDLLSRSDQYLNQARRVGSGRDHNLQLLAAGAEPRNVVRPKHATPTNAVFAKTDQAFQSACIKADVTPTRRQASKFRRGKGLAHLAL